MVEALVATVAILVGGLILCVAMLGLTLLGLAKIIFGKKG